MEFEIKENKTVEVKYLQVHAGVRYWEDATVNGVEDEEGLLIPFRTSDTWSPIIDIDNGVILEWPEGTTADIHYKVCDDGTYKLLDENKKSIKKIDGYVPNIMCPEDNGFGDYIIMVVDEKGKINNWVCDLSDFE